MQEIWKDIKGYEGLYQISNLGNVKSLKRNRFNYRLQRMIIVNKEKLLKQSFDGKKYLFVTLQKHKSRKNYRIHRLVAESFIPNPNNLPQVNHIDGNKTNNCVSNLEWCDGSYNVKESFRLGLSKKGAVHPNSKKVLQYDLNGNFIKEWNCVIDAINNLHLPKYAHSSISLCCRGKTQSAYGFKWKYID